MNANFKNGFEKRAFGVVKRIATKAMGATRRLGNAIAGQGTPGGAINRVGTAIAKNPGTVAAAGATGVAGLGTGAMLAGGKNG